MYAEFVFIITKDKGKLVFWWLFNVLNVDFIYCWKLTKCCLFVLIHLNLMYLVWSKWNYCSESFGMNLCRTLTELILTCPNTKLWKKQILKWVMPSKKVFLRHMPANTQIILCSHVVWSGSLLSACKMWPWTFSYHQTLIFWVTTW